ncbi:MAG TPA: nucleotide disphospho-sugar-binding domain-containing protein [Casimicrobiaceae bacterium]|nr:nucleotide disphospho-sugar-binding domain-containing protein [Casimicrobiaceae bacterium]
MSSELEGRSPARLPIDESATRGIAAPDAPAPRRFMFVAPPFISHALPMVSIAKELERRGHAIGWISHPLLRRWLPDSFEFAPLTENEAYRAAMVEIETQEMRFPADGFVRLIEDVMVPLARATLPEVDDAVDAFAPDAMVVDQHTFAGVAVARRRGIPWATSAPTAQLQVLAKEGYGSVGRWLDRALALLQEEQRLPPTTSFDISPDLVLVYTSRDFAEHDAAMPYPSQFRFVGPALDYRDESIDFPWDLLAEGPRLFVSLGTILGARGMRFMHTVVEALAERPVQVIVSAHADVLSQPPSNFLVRPWIPQLRILEHVDAVLTHGGAGTVHEALAFGVPMVVAPVMHDEFLNAGKLVSTGAGVRIKYGRPDAATLRSAVFEVLRNPTYRAVAQRFGQSYRRAGGTRIAADWVAQLANRGRAH